MNYAKRNHQSGNLNVRKFVLRKKSKVGQNTLNVQDAVSTKRPYLICRSMSQQITKICNFHLDLNESKQGTLTVTQLFLKKVQRQKCHPIPSVFDLIRIQRNTNKGESNSYQNLSFNILAYPNSKLVEVATQIVCKFGLLEFSSKLGVIRLIKQIQSKYNVVSYHNFAHAFSLMHMYYHLIKMDTKFKALFTKEEIGFTLIAALAHDINHPGNNNGFQVKTKSQLAVQANNEAVLEKMHIKTFFNILKAKNISILEKSKNPSKNKELIVRAILSTDVAKHFKGVEQLKLLRQKNQFDPKNIEHRNFALEQAFHACDIGNPCLQYQDYINWASLLTYQFDYQTAMEANKGVQATQMLKYKGIKQFYAGQTGFINFLCFPLWKQLTEIWQGFKPLLTNLQNNLKILKQKQVTEDKS